MSRRETQAGLLRDCNGEVDAVGNDLRPVYPLRALSHYLVRLGLPMEPQAEKDRVKGKRVQALVWFSRVVAAWLPIVVGTAIGQTKPGDVRKAYGEARASVIESLLTTIYPGAQRGPGPLPQSSGTAPLMQIPADLSIGCRSVLIGK